MTEAGWRACKDSRESLWSISWHASDRRLRLFACACGRNVWEAVGQGPIPSLIYIGKNFADGFAGGGH